MLDINEMTVLLTDDMPNMINSLRRMMKILGYGKYFFTAGNGEEALKILKKEPVDLAFLDYNMPMMTGVEVLKEIREDRVLRDMPVIMITAQAYQEFVAEAGESDTDAYILKPVTVKVLEEKVNMVVENANNPSPMVFHLKLARDYEEDGNIDNAIEMARLAMEANPKASRPIRE
ncbi:MAG: response regulator, partial [Deltaproteobacteria bacterium]|nr:response regulator [Deltaproteobacteria bacterium]